MRLIKELRLWKLFLVAALAECMQESMSAYTGCSPGTHRVISYNNTLVPEGGVTASSEDSQFNPDDDLFHRNNIPLRLWCSESFEEAMRSRQGLGLSEISDNFTSDFDIHVAFSVPLLITHIITSGFSNGFVNNFTVSHGSELDGPLMPYHYSDTTKEFIAQQIDTVFTLRQPLAALRLQFNISDGLMTPSGRLCWHLTLLGCTLQEGIREAVDAPPVQQLPTNPLTCPTVPTTEVATSPEGTTAAITTPTTTTTASTTTTTATTTTATTPTTPTTTTPTPTASAQLCIPTLQTGEEEEETSRGEETVTTAVATPIPNSQLLLIVVPTAGAVLLLVACMLGVVLCISLGFRPRRWRKNSSRLTTETLGSTDTLGMVDNELYKSRSSVFPMSVNRTGAMVMDKNSAAAGASSRGEPIYENCTRSAYPSSAYPSSAYPSSAYPSSAYPSSTYPRHSHLIPTHKESGFYESVSPRNHQQAEIEQSTKSVDSMVENPNYSVPFPLSYQPLNTMSEEPLTPTFLPAAPQARVSSINMMDNECYSTPSCYENSKELSMAMLSTAKDS